MRREIFVRLFDLHCDTLGVAADTGASFTKNTCDVDLIRGRRYACWTQTFAIWLPDGLSLEAATLRCENLLNTAERWMAETADFHLTVTGASFQDTAPGCRALLSVENGGALAADFAMLATLYSRGVRMVGLTWNGDNAWGAGCFGTGEGLTRAGRRALSHLEGMSLVVDVSHLGRDGFRQVEHLAQKPFVATHSNAYAITPHPRNLTDDQFRTIRDRGGVVGLNLYGEHLGGWDFAAVRRHLEHFLALDGEKTVCFGTDLDGMTAPASWDGIAVMEKLWQYLADAGYPSKLLDAIFYQNACTFFVRALDYTEEKRKHLCATPVHETIKPM